MEKIEVSERLDQAQPPRSGRPAAPGRRHPHPERLDHLERARMDREDDRQVAGDDLEGREDPPEGIGIVHVRRTVQGQKSERRRHPQTAHDIGGVGPRQEAPERVDHHVAHPVDPARRDTLRDQVPVRVRAGGEQQIGERVRDDPVDLLRHRAIARAQSRLDVRHPDRRRRLRRHDRARQRRVHVPHHDHPVGPVVRENLLERLHDARRLDGVGRRADTQMDVRRRDLQVLEEDVGHQVVVVLPRVQQPRVEQVGPRPELAQERRDLHEVRAGAGDEEKAERPPGRPVPRPSAALRAHRRGDSASGAPGRPGTGRRQIVVERPHQVNDSSAAASLVSRRSFRKRPPMP